MIAEARSLLYAQYINMDKAHACGVKLMQEYRSKNWEGFAIARFIMNIKAGLAANLPSQGTHCWMENNSNLC